MPQYISGPGVGLPYPQNLYPSELANAPYDAPQNTLTLQPSQELQIPATGANGWLVDPGPYGVLQWLDPVTGAWRGSSSARTGPQVVTSDGFTRRIANLTACPISAIVAGGGSGFAQSTATISANIGGSTWQAVVGGQLSVSTVSVVGGNYTMPPLVFIQAPPAPGYQATAYSTITNGTVTSVSLVNFGAGYKSAPTAVLLPNPADPNAGSITQATVVLVLNAATSTAICAAICTNNGATLSTLTALTLTAAGGGGSGATITPLVMQTVASATAATAGTGWGNVAAPAGVTTTGGSGTTSVSAIVNPAFELTGYIPRPALISTTTSSGGAISAPVVVDGGLFVTAPSAVIIPGGTVPTALASIALTMGSANTTALLQPL